MKQKNLNSIFGFPKIFQMIFVIPVVLQLRINLQYAAEGKLKNDGSISTTTPFTATSNGNTTASPTNATSNYTTTTTTTIAGPVDEIECDDSKIHIV